jgi:hypothetical protein
MDRAVAMSASVAKALRAVGLEDEGLDLVLHAHDLAMRPRVEQLDDHHPSYLHPGRCVLILVRDVGLSDAVSLAASALLESESESLRVPQNQMESEVGAQVARVLSLIPAPGEERLVERLVLLPVTSRLAALSERLDQLRHAHLLPDRVWWAAIHEETTRAWLPVAERTHERIAQRYRHWHRTFARRL